MRTFTVHVNGKAYEVAVEETTIGGIPAPAPVAAAPAAFPVAAAPAAPAAPAPAPKAAAPAGSEPVKSPMPGIILDVKVKPGDAVKRGQVLLILEAMKMENEIMSGRDGTIATVEVSKGSNVSAGDVLVTLA